MLLVSVLKNHVILLKSVHVILGCFIGVSLSFHSQLENYFVLKVYYQTCSSQELSKWSPCIIVVGVERIFIIRYRVSLTIRSLSKPPDDSNENVTKQKV